MNSTNGEYRHPRRKISGRILVIAPFINHEAVSSRPRLVSEVLAEFAPVDILTTAFDHFSKRKRRPFYEDQRRVISLWTLPYQHNLSPARFLSHLLFSCSVAFFYLRHRSDYDAVYATLPLTLAAFPVFCASSQSIGIADLIDIWPDTLPFPDWIRKLFAPVFSLWEWAFRATIRRTDALLSVSDRFLDQARPDFRGKPTAARRIYLGSRALPVSRRPQQQSLTLVYVGNIGHLYDFETLLAALSRRREQTCFYLVGAGDRKDWLLDQLRQLNIRHRDFGVIYDPRELGQVLSACDVGFNGYCHTTAAFSYKAGTYFSAGLPILNSMAGDLGTLVETRGLGFNYQAGDTEALLAALDQCQPQRLNDLSANVRAFFAAELEQDVVKSQVRQFLKELFAAKSTQDAHHDKASV